MEEEIAERGQWVPLSDLIEVERVKAEAAVRMFQIRLNLQAIAGAMINLHGKHVCLVGANGMLL
eukprot:1159534-Pelagomonas_calceolata.AAC.10